MKNNTPKVHVDSATFEESRYTRRNKVTNDYDMWNATTLYQWVKEQKLKPFDIPLAALDISFVPFDLNSLDDFIFQCKRVKNTDIKIPIILDSCGVVADGYHRIARAILEGKKTIKAYRITNMPKPDKVEDKNGNTVKQ